MNRRVSKKLRTFDVTFFFDHTLLVNKVAEGRSQQKEGKVYSTEEAKEKLKKWLK